MKSSSILSSKPLWSVGMLIALSSWGSMFLTLAWAYVAFRLRHGDVFDAVLTGPMIALGWFNTTILSMSSLLLHWAFKEEYRKKSRSWMMMVMGLALIFIAGQWLLWQQGLASGWHWQRSQSGSFFFLLTGCHVLHVLGACIALTVLFFNWDQWYGTTKSWGIKIFWDFLLVMWLIFFVLIFIFKT